MTSINDNEVAIDMLRDITNIIDGIERNRSRVVLEAFDSLKKHTLEFEKVFKEFKDTYN